MVHRLDWRAAKNPREVVGAVGDALLGGKLVVLPTDTRYAAAALAGRPDAVARLARAWGDGAKPGFVLVPAKPADLAKLVSPLPAVARRLAERCWPGPVTLSFPCSLAGPAFRELPDSVRRQLTGEDGFALSLPHHPLLGEVLRMLPAPLALASWTGDPHSPALDAVEIVVDDGPPRYAQPPTVVRIDADGFRVVENGAIAASRLQRLANEMILFVCTGNTCRSPMAEALFKRMLADALHCAPDELPERGYTVVSAGVAASAGAPAAEHARTAVRRFGGELDDHAAQALAPQWALAADRLLVMTREHQDIVARLWPAVAGRIARVDPAGDVVDPFGGAQVDYDACAEQLRERLAPLLRDVLARAAVGRPAP